MLTRAELVLQMFMPAIVGQGTVEQKRELLPKCRTLQIIGTYAQTELGHGTFLRVRACGLAASHPPRAVPPCSLS